MVEVMFRRYDKNGDGVLNYDEMPDNLKAEKDKWDTNKDGLIDLKEFKEYMKGRMDQIRAEMGAGNQGGANAGSAGASGQLPLVPIPIEEEAPKRTVYRAGNLPKELPAWFAQYDTDGDGQIGLYEWKKTGRELSEFQKMDRNGDGFLTVEEVLAYQASQNKGKTGTVVAGGPSPGNGPGGNFGGPQGGGFGGPPGGPGGQRWNGGPQGGGNNGGGNRWNGGPPGGGNGGGGRRGGMGPNSGADNQPQDGGQRGGRGRRQNGGG
jgi:Ca2+-binding EF-hand superfamily protein